MSTLAINLVVKVVNMICAEIVNIFKTDGFPLLIWSDLCLITVQFSALVSKTTATISEATLQRTRVLGITSFNLNQHLNQQQISASIISSFSFQCSVQACAKERTENRLAVEKFHKQYGIPGTLEKCHYDVTDPMWGAVIHVFKPGMSVFHAMFWPSLALLLGSLTCAIFCHRCRAYEARKEMKDNSSSASTAAFLVEKSPPMKREVKPKEKGKAKVKAKMKLKEKGLEEEKKEILEKGGIFEDGGNGHSPPLKKKANWLWSRQWSKMTSFPVGHMITWDAVFKCRLLQSRPTSEGGMFSFLCGGPCCDKQVAFSMHTQDSGLFSCFYPSAKGCVRGFMAECFNDCVSWRIATLFLHWRSEENTVKLK